MQDTATIPDVRREPLSSKLSITAIILTFNEEVHVDRCLSRIQPLVERVIIVDSFSTDRTVEISRCLGAEVVQRRFKHQADQFQWALDNCDIRSDWVLRLDADEYLEELLIDEIRDRLPRLASNVSGVNVNRKFVFMGRWIKWGGYYPTILTRLWRTGSGRIEQRWMDEHVVLEEGAAVHFKRGTLIDENLSGVDAWMTKHNRYATRQMVDFINREYDLFSVETEVDFSANHQARLKRFMRNEIFGRAPLYLRSILYFLYRYVMRLGFLDGKHGLVFHTLHGLCYFLLIDAKIDEARAFIRSHGLDRFRDHLVRDQRISL
jgi:glycosyltransferase involved in cell wall biosynthesis